MSVNHIKRIEGVVNEAFKAAAFGETYGWLVTGPGIWPVGNEKGEITGQGPAWFILVSIRNPALGQPDFVAGFPVQGIMPPDDNFRKVATELMNNVRQQRDQAQDNGLDAARAAFKQQMAGAKA